MTAPSEEILQRRRNGAEILHAGEMHDQQAMSPQDQRRDKTASDLRKHLEEVDLAACRRSSPRRDGFVAAAAPSLRGAASKNGGQISDNLTPREGQPLMSNRRKIRTPDHAILAALRCPDCNSTVEPYRGPHKIGDRDFTIRHDDTCPILASLGGIGAVTPALLFDRDDRRDA
jgi:hypothetical protein